MARDVELEKQIDAYVKGHLTEKQAQELWEELLKNPGYIELLNTEISLRNMVTEADSGKSSSGTKQRHALIHSLQNSWKWAAAAVAIVIVAVAVNFFLMDTEQTLDELALNEIPLSESLASAPALRSGQARSTPGDSLLNRGFKEAISGNISKAMELYDVIIQEYPDQPSAVQAYLNRGIIQFNRYNYEGAIVSFKEVVGKAEEQSFLREKGYWYLGNAYINTDSLSRAHEAIFEVYSMEGVYRNPAGDILQKLDKQLGNPPGKYD
ncbi:Tetratricopeptide repeat-containing protein [Fodinibius roseus]|uniref:Tetratricopeptide repeat-containing protein n=1 Tax=Fodinibius roseus TaxID=1194090 RepID=A0A1M5FRD2_9BACT|nr:tetratricopeptide repeat protein [Fodinibius roseus]SHF93989.1 Tetratricopeptide repeat-containing protein [Fodinibius roseus]